MDWIIRKSNPGTLHHFGELLLLDSGRNATDLFRVAKQHLHFRAVICTTRGIETCVEPVAKVAVLPNRHIVGSASASLEVVGTGEGFEEELVTLRLSGVDASAVGWDHVVALLVVVVAEELWLSMC